MFFTETHSFQEQHGAFKTWSPELILSKEHGNALQDRETKGSMLWTDELSPERKVWPQRLQGPGGKEEEGLLQRAPLPPH